MNLIVKCYQINLCQYIAVKDTKVRPNVLMMWTSSRK